MVDPRAPPLIAPVGIRLGRGGGFETAAILRALAPSPERLSSFILAGSDRVRAHRRVNYSLRYKRENGALRPAVASQWTSFNCGQCVCSTGSTSPPSRESAPFAIEPLRCDRLRVNFVTVAHRVPDWLPASGLKVADVAAQYPAPPVICALSDFVLPSTDEHHHHKT